MGPPGRLLLSLLLLLFWEGNLFQVNYTTSGSVYFLFVCVCVCVTVAAKSGVYLAGSATAPPAAALLVSISGRGSS